MNERLILKCQKDIQTKYISETNKHACRCS